MLAAAPVGMSACTCQSPRMPAAEVHSLLLEACLPVFMYAMQGIEAEGQEALGASAWGGCQQPAPLVPTIGVKLPAQCPAVSHGRRTSHCQPAAAG